MFTVIQHQQQLFGAEELHQRLASAHAGRGGHREHRRHRIVHSGRVAHRRQLTQPRPVTKPSRHLSGYLQRQPGLAHPAGPVKVTTRASPSAAAVCSSSRARPMNELTCNGKLPVRSATV
jgi:hypothetical protein